MAPMTSAPHLLYWTCALLCVASVTAGKMCHECEKPEWTINWDKMPQRSIYPSGTTSITPFFDIDDILQSIGRIWRADNVLESLSILCLRYGPEIHNVTKFPIIPPICDPILEAIQSGQNLNITAEYDTFVPMFPPLDYEINFFHLFEVCDVAGKCGNCSLEKKLHFIGECVNVRGINPFQYGYNLAQRWAPLIFDLLEWLGPSRINFLDIFHTCSALRYFMGMSAYVFKDKANELAPYLGAEYLQYLFINSSCTVIDESDPSFDSYHARVLGAAYNAMGRSLCLEIEGAESREEFLRISKDAIDFLVDVLTSPDYCKDALTQEMSPLNESMIDLYCHRLDRSLLPNEISPEHTANPLVLIGIDIFREMLLSNSVYGVAITVCHASLMDPYLKDGSMGLMCRALLNGGSDGLEDVCIQQKTFFNEFLQVFLGLDEPMGPSRNVEVRPIGELDVILLGIEWIRVLFDLQDLSIETLIDATDSFYHRKNLKTMLISAIDVILDGHLIPALETMCIDSSSFTEGLEKYINAQNPEAITFNQDSKQMADLLTDVLPLLLGVENTDILCDNVSTNIRYNGSPLEEYVEEIRENIMNFLTRHYDCLYFMYNLEKALSRAFSTTEGFLNSVIQSATGFRDYSALCTAKTVYMKPKCYDFIVKMQPAVSRSERMLIGLNFPYCYGSYWTYERAQFTGTGRTLPELNLTISSPSPVLKFLEILPDETHPLDHVGVYVHTYRSNFNNKEVSIHSVIQSAGILTFDIPTQTAYIGDNTVIGIARPNLRVHRRRRIRWYKDGSMVSQGRGQNQLRLGNVDSSDAAIYEIFAAGRRSRGYHGILRLIVTACPKGYYNAPFCDNYEYFFCLNGGVLRQDTPDMQCICAYPFGGGACHNKIRVPPFEEPPLDYCIGIECKGAMFCRRDPFGCKCASGYHGKGCREVCPEGRYGPSCEGTCHCQGDCDPVTGECDVMCEDGMFGWNCQYTEPWP